MQTDTNWEDNRPWSELYRQAGEIWADLEAAAQLLEDCKSATLAEWMAGKGDIPVNRAEQLVKASPQWKDYVIKTVEARKAANKAKVRLESIKMRAMEQQARDATYRAEMRLT